MQLMKSLYEFASSLPTELDLVAGHYYITFPDTLADDGWIEAAVVDRSIADQEDFTRYIEENNPQPQGIIPKSYVEVVYSPDLSVQLKAALDSASLHSDYSARRSGVLPISGSQYERFIAPKKNLMQRFTPFVLSGAEKYVMSGCLPVPEDFKKQFSPLYSIKQSVGLSTRNGQPRHSVGVVEYVNPQYTQKKSDQEPLFITDGPQWLDEARYFATVSFTQPVHIGGHDKRLSSFFSASVSGNFVTFCIAVGTQNVTNSYDQKLYGGALLEQQEFDFMIFRRYSHFVMLYNHLKRWYPMLFVPVLPTKNLGLNDNMQENERKLIQRMHSLERWMQRILGHFVLREDPAIEAFLYSDVYYDHEVVVPDDLAVNEPYYQCPTLSEAFKKLTSTPNDPAEFYLRVFHPEFNLQPDLNRSATVYGSIRGVSQLNDARGSTMSLSGLAIEDDVTGDYASLKVQKFFLKHTEDRLRMVMYTMSAYIHSLSNDAASKLANALEILVDVGDDHVWCHQSNCVPCQNLSAVIRRVGTTINGTTQETPIDQYHQVMEWINDWTECFLRDGEVINPIIQCHKSGVIIGKELDSRPKQSSRKSSTSQSPLYQPVVVDDVVPGHLQPSHILARLSTLYNINHAEVYHWTHRQRQVEFLAIMQKICSAELKRAQKNAEGWQHCQEYIENVTNNLTK